MGERAIWDVPVRLFHWALAILAVASFVTGKVAGGWMAWHLRSGYAILALLLFRLAWGVAGGDTARFRNFLHGPRAVIDYARSLEALRPAPWVGHNPLGGWVVMLMLAVLLLQAATGLFSDDEIATQGPLASRVADAVVARMTSVHKANGWVIAAVVAVHVAAIAIYQWRLKVNLAGPMVHGGALPEGSDSRHASHILALALFAAACAAVYWLVTIVPRSP